MCRHAVPTVLVFHVQVCLESSERRPDGAVTFTANGRISKVPAGSAAELFPSSSQALYAAEGAVDSIEQQGAWRSDAEEEEAFLEAVTRQQLTQHSGNLLLKCRWAVASDWACWHVLREGTACTAGTSHPCHAPAPSRCRRLSCRHAWRHGSRRSICPSLV